MPGARITVTDVLGLNLALDARQNTAPTLLFAKNVLIDAEGPYSAFGTDLVSNAWLENPTGAETFEIGTDIILATTGAFLKYDDDTQQYYPVVEFTDSGEVWPWTMSQVGVDYWFAKKGVAYWIQYRSTTGLWTLHTAGSGNYPASPYAVVQAGGRGILLATGIVRWSAIDDGTDLAASLTTGAGFQSLAVLGNGEPLAVKETDAGFMVFTRSGLGSFELVTSSPTFRYKPVRTKEIPLNPFSIINVEQGTIIYLAKPGFRTTNGGKPTVWEPLMSEYITRKLLPTLGDLSANAITKLTFNEERQWLMLSVGSVTTEGLYNYALVFYTPKQRWGRFDQIHYGFGELDLHSGPYSGFNFGYFSAEGYLNKFVNLPRREMAQLGYSDNTYYSHGNSDFPVQLISGNYSFPSNMRINTVNWIDFQTSVPGVYYLVVKEAEDETGSFVIPVEDTDISNYQVGEDWNYSTLPDEDWNAITGSENWNDGDAILFRTGASIVTGLEVDHWDLVPRQFGSIDSRARIGLFRFVDADTVDRLCQINNISVGTDLLSVFDEEDWNTSTNPDENWNTDSGDEDWGSGVVTASDFDILLTGSLDGISVFEDNEQSPDEQYVTESGKFFAFNNVTGLWIFIDLIAEDVDQSFHLKTMELSGILAGRLF